MLYGAAEFSRDTDLAVLAEPANLARLETALAELKAECIAVPPLSMRFLLLGHAVHFRCHHPKSDGMRIDVMSVMRGVADFRSLWKRRTSVDLGDGATYEVLSLQDLVQSKKTQRDKDWVMLRKLIEAHFFQNHDNPGKAHAAFWLKECRTPQMLQEVAAKHPRLARHLMRERALLRFAASGNEKALTKALVREEEKERELDRMHWLPLKRELEQLSHKR